MNIQRTNADNTDYQRLIIELDKNLAIGDGDQRDFFAQFNTSTNIKYVLVAYDGEAALGCGAIKEYEPGVMEVKRMFVVEEHRGKGVASLILKHLEAWAKELGNHKCILETGVNQKEAIYLYPKNGYQLTENYGQYIGVENSVCFSKNI